MTVRETLHREHRFVDQLLERLEAALRGREEDARPRSRQLLILLAPCLQAHLGIERLLFARETLRRSHSRPSTLGTLGLPSLLEDVRVLAAQGDEHSFPRYREAVLRLVEQVRCRLQAEESWTPRAPGRPEELRRSLARRIRDIEVDVRRREAVLDDYVRPGRR